MNIDYGVLATAVDKYNAMKQKCSIAGCIRYVLPHERCFKYSGYTISKETICIECTSMLVEKLVKRNGAHLLHKLIPYPSKLEETTDERHQELATYLGDESQRLSGIPLPK